MLGEDGPCHEATASVSAMAMAMMLAGRRRRCEQRAPVGRLAVDNNNAVTAALCSSFFGSITTPSGPRRGFAKTDTGSCQAPCWGRDEGLR